VDQETERTITVKALAQLVERLADERDALIADRERLLAENHTLRVALESE